MYELQVVNFIKTHDDWEDILSQKPYCLKIKRDMGLIMLCYSQIDSDFYNPIVRECRGIILEDVTFNPVCVPFFKFGNYGEGYASEIDWSTARTEQKVDGSLIKVFYYKGQWLVATSGTIDAFKAELGGSDLAKMTSQYKNFGQLFGQAAANSGLILVDNLDINYTYMFELVSPYNKVVIPYDEIKIYHIGSRNMLTFEEELIDIGVEQPQRYNLHTLDQCINAASVLPYSQEGYVVVDKDWNRVKVKSPAYVAAHHIKNNGDVNICGLLELILQNNHEEFLNYFPEYTDIANEMIGKMDSIIAELATEVKFLSQNTFETQKDFALMVKDLNCSTFYFQWRKDNSLIPEAWVKGQDVNRLKMMLGYEK